MTACLFFILFIFCFCQAECRSSLKESIEVLANQTRRILNGHEVGETRPYMVYLRPAPNPPPSDPNWLCGGVIIHPRYILTSAACIEDAKHFYVISGTHRWIPLHDKSDPCVVNGAKKAIWKCVPKSYVFDGNDFNNIRWMANDIAVVKVEDDFNFKRRVKGCDFIPKLINYNNQSLDLEKAGSAASIAGWGSQDRYGEASERSSGNSPNLLETDVVILSKKNCKKRWPERYHYIVDGYMICGKDGLDSENMNQLCTDNEVNCKEMLYSDTEENDEENPEAKRRLIADPEAFEMNPRPNTNETRRVKSTLISGGFCENDHGGPLVVGHGTSAIVVGVISASLTKDITQKCYGPFLYTSVYQNRHLINCAIYKEMGVTCKKLLRSTNTQITETQFDWNSHPDGPPKTNDSEIPVKPNVRSKADPVPPALKIKIKTTEKATIKPETVVAITVLSTNTS